MNIIQALILGMVQGLTEFLPISSSAHLVIVPELLGVESSLAFDTLLHVGTLIAVISYFRSDVIAMIKAFFSSLADIPRGRFKEEIRNDQFKRLAWLILVGTIPAGLMGILLKDFFESLFSSVSAVGFFLLITGFILWGVERMPRGEKKTKEISFTNSLIVGIAQGCAIAPGISRSGATIATSLYLGFDREMAARFSFLLSIPAILGAALIQLKDLTAGFDISTGSFVGGLISAMIFSYLAIKFLMGYIKKHSLVIFAYYCWTVGIITLILTVVL
ncbi:undecaprenyl-diphosphate phosphatase [Methanobacterium sp. CWC-01]|uniref:undecaprenyl-diphosphate phosphatase n=1 Tax=Methanobacterium aridiramus TaxID=2584467 RepID=UPI002574FAEA|nr:undecaprenyl-diphosphate phosphatase [Methanobacterium sp. CWC-01]WJI10571.1 undecaprenyl-diphosphate phosphatase [Methanobacterium sp. CWC-01]